MEPQLISTEESLEENVESTENFSCFLSDSREELSQILRSRLIECGWRDQVANMCRNLIQKHGIEQIRYEQIINEVRVKARQSVPDHVKTEVLEMIRKLNQSQQENHQLRQQPNNSMIPEEEEPIDPPNNVPMI